MIMTVSVVKYSHYRHGDNISSNRKYTLQFIDMKVNKSQVYKKMQTQWWTLPRQCHPHIFGI